MNFTNFAISTHLKMNPSATGWINKFGQLATKNLVTYVGRDQLYLDLKTSGFVYGINIKTPPFITPDHGLSEDEKAKINLLNALFFIYLFERSDTDFQAFLVELSRFYHALKMDATSLLGKLTTGRGISAKLEKLIESRIYINDNVISKTFNSVITNSLLFIDVITFQKYLSNPLNVQNYAKRVEYLAVNVANEALSSKVKNKNDERLQQVFSASLSFIDLESAHFDRSYRDRIINDANSWENQFLLDIACLSVWEDNSLDYQESNFVFSLGMEMGFNANQIASALEEVTLFFENNSKEVPFLKDGNLAVQFYESMGKIVDKLILRNSKRLQKELAESGELVLLLSKSTRRELSAEEKKKVQDQLIDIFKSIPSLAIFLLPGGAVLLPIFIKLIPKLLPSSFDENRLDSDQKTIK